MKYLKFDSVTFLKVAFAIVIVPALSAGMVTGLISIITAIFNTPNWELIGGLYWFFFILSLIAFGVHLHAEDDYRRSIR